MGPTFASWASVIPRTNRYLKVTGDLGGASNPWPRHVEDRDDGQCGEGRVRTHSAVLRIPSENGTLGLHPVERSLVMSSRLTTTCPNGGDSSRTRERGAPIN